jgi:predicted amidohydrolase
MASIKLALAQIEVRRGSKKQNLRKIQEFTHKAKRQGADLIIFPELSLTGYVISDQVYELAETVPGSSSRAIEELAKETGTYIIFGMPELTARAKATVSNTAVCVGPNGLIGKYRKIYLPTHSVFDEKRYFRPGHQTVSFETSLGNIGLCICYDLFFPEVCRLTRLKGAQLIVAISASPAVRRSFFEVLISARALENTAFLAYVNLVGVEDGLQFWGGSRVAGPNGDLIAKANYDDETLLLCDVNFDDLKPAEAFIPTLKDLRPEFFDELKKEAREF